MLPAPKAAPVPYKDTPKKQYSIKEMANLRDL